MQSTKHGMKLNRAAAMHLAALLAISCTIAQVEAAEISHIQLHGSLGAQAVEQAYNSLLDGIQKASQESSVQYRRSVDSQGNVELHWPPQNEPARTAETTEDSHESWAMLSPNGNITCRRERTFEMMSGPHEVTASSESFARRADGSLIYHVSGRDRFHKPAQLTITVHADGSIESTLNDVETLKTLTDIRPSISIPGGADAARDLSNYVSTDASGSLALAVGLHDSRQTQAVKSAYNALLNALKKMPIGTSQGKALAGHQRNETIQYIVSKDGLGKKTIQTVENDGHFKSTTTQVVSASGNVDIHFETNSPIGNQIERYERLPGGNLQYTIALHADDPGKMVVTTMPDGSCHTTAHAYVPMVRSLNAPGQLEADIHWHSF